MSYTRINYLPQEVLSLPTVDSATAGAITTFNTDLNLSLFKCVCSILASGGNGTPSTPIPIVGHSELNLVRCGKNLFDVTLTSQTANDVVFTVNSDKTITANGTADGNVFLQIGTIHVIAGQTYTLTGCPSGGGSGVYSLYVSLTGGNKNDYGSGITFTATATEDAPVRIAVYNTKTVNGTYKPQIVLGSTPSAYAPYNGTPYLVSFGQTVYGGYYTADGKLRITHTYIADMSSLNWQYNSVIGNFYTELTDVPKVFSSENYLTSKLCSMFTIVDGSVGSVNHAMQYYNSYLRFRVEEYSDVPTFKQAIENCQFAYELATPIEIDVSSISVEAVSGVNNVFCDTGDIEQLTYFESVGMKIQKGV